MYSTVDSLVRRSTLILENLDSLDNSIGSFDTNIHYKYYIIDTKILKKNKLC